MGSLNGLIGLACSIAGIVCYIIILIDAFRDEIWKGVVSLICGLYGLYYAIFEFEHEYKWLIVIGAALGGGIGYILRHSMTGGALP